MKDRITYFRANQISLYRLLVGIAGLLFALCWTAQAAADELLLRRQSNGEFFQVNQIASVNNVPWGMVFISPSDILFTERSGRIAILNRQSESIRPVSGGPEVMSSGQGGLLDVAVAPGYVPGDWIYFTYSKQQKGRGVTKLARARLDRYQLVDWRDVLITKSASGTSRHFGSRIAFDGTGHLYFTVGDRGVRPNGQNLTTHAGSILRLHLDGRVPENNPFVKQHDALPEIWSYGHRNPQGIAYDMNTHRLWAIEHGPRGGDEINLILPGRNYGWPIISHGKEYWSPAQVGEGTEKEGMEQPVKVYIPSIAPGSLILYSGKAFRSWKGNLLAGALKLTHLNRVTLDKAGRAVSEERLLESLGERIRGLIESPEGWLYLSTDSGLILSLRPVEK
ncbi:MAG: PQQ-dependent sugar dehydrogenase [Deltaproteobacteria bacterium]|jgi:aldose sugar dehydrogenase|nr:PQQ-dependent sugar dehydrogenase [Deltaproteobacteria bacterium]MBT4642997.1 PQQ-dependent sugar dehydrogenase [Deltaproteobacteria bacterium]MBT6499218.1 PQQ-dependent sugar dehydrogenase [Deltaproteobacteria bacterium]MBT7154224.1 PQQ-dependent sugar dehydrogenase [Deltaproteobacteria bacterium]MBT7712928.1 PQQ-dependent sugar dehydrogenase [Deltaproteobacteria bacterium]